MTVFEREDALFSRASVANEGKVHLGYVYAADRSFRTAARLIEDALVFRPVLERWMTSAAFDACVYAPFRYVVPPDSALPVAEIKRHFARVEAHVDARSRAPERRYLGPGAADAADSGGTGDDPRGTGIATRERGVWPPGIARAVCNSVASHPRIEVATKTPVRRVDVCGEDLRVVFDDPARAAEGPFSIVINAAWADRRNIDRASGFADREVWFTRFKFGVVLNNASRRLTGAMPANATALSGRYGDSVYFPQDDSLYCCWYPVGMTFSTTGDHAAAARPDLPDTERAARDTWSGFATVDPDYRRLCALAAPIDVDILGDYILAKGASDIDDPASRLHQRQDHGPKRLAPGYWSVETGKYTSAPRCAMQCIDAILGPG